MVGIEVWFTNSLIYCKYTKVSIRWCKNALSHGKFLSLMLHWLGHVEGLPKTCKDFMSLTPDVSHASKVDIVCIPNSVQFS